jgi:hypothetical protein
MTEGYIYDETGANVATIIDGKVFADRDAPPIGIVRDGMVCNMLGI